MLTQKRLKQLLDYDPDAGTFTRKLDRGGIKAGSVAGCKHNQGYLQLMIDGKMYLAHRLAWLYVHGAFPKDQIDHINHDRTDNRISNLREATNAENGRNQKMYSNNKSGVVGVSWDVRHEKWESYIHVNGKKNYLGYFNNKDDAETARKAAEIEHRFHQNHGKDLAALANA